MSISKIKNVLRGYNVSQVNSKELTIILKQPTKHIMEIIALLNSKGFESTPKNIKNKYSIHHKNIKISILPQTISFKTPNSIRGENDSVTNRLHFAHYIFQLSKHINQFNIDFVGNKKINIKNCQGVKFLGKSIADLRLITDKKSIPLTVNNIDGIYYSNVQQEYTKNLAFDGLELAIQNQFINATIDDYNNIKLESHLAIKADTQIVRQLISKHIRNGFGIIGDFTVNSFNYVSRNNTLTVKCNRVIKTSSDFSSEDEVYIILSNDKNSSLFELNGLRIDLVPKRNLPSNTIIINM